jgi:hypothetical protein
VVGLHNELNNRIVEEPGKSQDGYLGQVAGHSTPAQEENSQESLARNERLEGNSIPLSRIANFGAVRQGNDAAAANFGRTNQTLPVITAVQRMPVN